MRAREEGEEGAEHLGMEALVWDTTARAGAWFTRNLDQLAQGPAEPEHFSRQVGLMEREPACRSELEMDCGQSRIGTVVQGASAVGQVGREVQVLRVRGLPAGQVPEPTHRNEAFPVHQGRAADQLDFERGDQTALVQKVGDRKVRPWPCVEPGGEQSFAGPKAANLLDRYDVVGS